MINHEINRLINFALNKKLIDDLDVIYSTNMLLGLLNLSDFKKEEINEELSEPSSILNNILDYAVSENIIDDTITERDLFDTKVMNCLMPRPSEVIAKFKENYSISPKKATEYYYDLSIASNYIRKSRIDKNIVWKASTEYGDLDITINLSKPEKDPKDIIKSKALKSHAYPKCLLQYSPYTYYNEHCIVLNGEHSPMKISKDTFKNLLDFVDIFPHYFVGSNADLPIVGGSILAHDHYQGGNYTFAMDLAPIEKSFKIKSFEDVNLGRVKWPMSVIRVSGTSKDKVIDLCDHILKTWRNYSDESVDILASTNGEPHNTITPIARFKDGNYEVDLVLRNNRTTDEYPLGIFHPHNEVHHIKKENIGLIEVMGLAVLPARLKEELTLIKENLLNNVEDISNNEVIEKHADWYKSIRNKYTMFTDNSIDDILREEVGIKFLEAISHSGVFKRNPEGDKAFDKFINIL